MITGTQIVAHLAGDYLLQSDWMALNKKKRSWPCFVHVVFYTLPFLFLTRSWPALSCILFTHFIIDRFNIISRLLWVKNHIGPFGHLNLDPKQMDYLLWSWKRPYPRWKHCKMTGYYDGDNVTESDNATALYRYGRTLQSFDRPVWIRVWLNIIADNTFHLILNALALYYL